MQQEFDRLAALSQEELMTRKVLGPADPRALKSLETRRQSMPVDFAGAKKKVDRLKRRKNTQHFDVKRGHHGHWVVLCRESRKVMAIFGKTKEEQAKAKEAAHNLNRR